MEWPAVESGGQFTVESRNSPQRRWSTRTWITPGMTSAGSLGNTTTWHPTGQPLNVTTLAPFGSAITRAPPARSPHDPRVADARPDVVFEERLECRSSCADDIPAQPIIGVSDIAFHDQARAIATQDAHNILARVSPATAASGNWLTAVNGHRRRR